MCWGEVCQGVKCQGVKFTALGTVLLAGHSATLLSFYFYIKNIQSKKTLNYQMTADM